MDAGARLARAALVLVSSAIVLAGCALEPEGARIAGGPTGPVGAPISMATPLSTGSPSDGSTKAGSTTKAGPTNAGSTKAGSTKGSGSGKAADQDLSIPFACPPPSITVLDGKELRKALKSAEPGDVIGLEPGTYPGTFTIKKSGTAKKPVYLCGPPDAVLSAPNQQSGYTLHLDGVSNWRLQGFSIHNGAKGIMLDKSHAVVLQGLSINGTGDEAVHLRRNSSGNVVQQLDIRKAGQVNAKYGEGIYVGSAKSNWCKITACEPDRSDDNKILNNRIALTTAESIDIKEGTSSGLVAGNVFDGEGMVASAADSWVDVKGNEWVIADNRGQTSPRDGFQVHVILKGWGDRNTFRGNTSTLTSTKGTAIMLQKPGKNIVRCDNVSNGAGKPFSKPCRG